MLEDGDALPEPSALGAPLPDWAQYEHGDPVSEDHELLVRVVLPRR